VKSKLKSMKLENSWLFKSKLGMINWERKCLHSKHKFKILF